MKRQTAPRGYMLLLVAASTTMLLALAFVVNARLSAMKLSAHADERRLQAIWLARSAAAAGRETRQDVMVAGEQAHLIVKREGRKVTASVSFDRFGTAHVVTDGQDAPEESYERVQH